MKKFILFLSVLISLTSIPKFSFTKQEKTSPAFYAEFAGIVLAATLGLVGVVLAYNKVNTWIADNMAVNAKDRVNELLARLPANIDSASIRTDIFNIIDKHGNLFHDTNMSIFSLKKLMNNTVENVKNIVQQGIELNEMEQRRLKNAAEEINKLVDVIYNKLDDFRRIKNPNQQEINKFLDELIPQINDYAQKANIPNLKEEAFKMAENLEKNGVFKPEVINAFKNKLNLPDPAANVEQAQEVKVAAEGKAEAPPKVEHAPTQEVKIPAKGKVGAPKLLETSDPVNPEWQETWQEQQLMEQAKVDAFPATPPGGAELPYNPPGGAELHFEVA